MAVPAVKESLSRQNDIVFAQIADDNVQGHLPIWGTFIILLALSGILFTGGGAPSSCWLRHLINGTPLCSVVERHDVRPSQHLARAKSRPASAIPATEASARQSAQMVAQEDSRNIGLGLFFFAWSFLFLSYRNRVTRAETFAAALAATADQLDSRLRFQIKSVFQGGKICDVLEKVNPEKGSSIDIMWTFFYREEHNTGLIDFCKAHKIERVRILLSRPGDEGIDTRVNDLKGPFRGLGCVVSDQNRHIYENAPQSWRASAKEIGLDNINFCKEILRRIERCETGKVKFQVRFTPDYVGRPMVIVRRPIGRLRGLFSSIWNFAHIPFVIFHERMFRPEHVAMGLYMSKEASAYPFIEYHPDPTYAPTGGISGDAVHMFDARWESSAKYELFSGTELGKSGGAAVREHIKGLEDHLESKHTIFRTGETTLVPKPRREKAKQDESDHDAPLPPNWDWHNYNRRDLDVGRLPIKNEDFDQVDRNEDRLSERSWDRRAMAFRYFMERGWNPWWGRLLWAAGGILSLLCSLVWSANLSTMEVGNIAAIVGVNVLRVWSFFCLYMTLKTESPRHQYEKCLSQTRGDIDNQEKFQIQRIFEGGKFFSIIEKLDLHEGDEINIMWSFLQHEEVTDLFFSDIVDRRLKVKILLVAPFGEGMRQRIQDIAQRYIVDSRVLSNLKAKSLANLEFLRRYIERREAYKGRFDCEVRFSPFYCARPMIIHKSTSRVFRQGASTSSQIKVAMGYFLSNESSKYPFTLFGATSDLQDGRSVAEHADEFFKNRWEYGLYGDDFFEYEKAAVQKLREDPAVVRAEMDAGMIEVPHGIERADAAE